MEVRVMQRGDRGLFIANDHKLLFPDRSWKDVKEGFVYDVEVTLDKGTYAFVKGKMLETEPIGVKNVDIDFNSSPSIMTGNINGQSFLLEYAPTVSRHGVYCCYVRTKGPFGVSLERVALPKRSMKVIEYLHAFSEYVNLNESFIEQCPVLNFESDAQYAQEMFKLLRQVYEHDHIIRKVNTELRVYNSSVVIGCLSYSHTLTPSYSVYAYKGELGKGEFERVVNFSQSYAEELFKKADPIGMGELMDFVREYKVCIGWNKYRGVAFDDRLTSKVFECNGSGVVVYAFNLNGYDLSWLETEEARPYVELVEESFERLAYLKKRLGKMRVPLDKLSVLNVMDWLAPFELHGDD